MNLLLIYFLSALQNFNNLFMTGSPIALNQLQERYDNYLLYEVTPRNERQQSLLNHLSDNHKNYDIWKYGGRSWHIMVGPNKFFEFLNITHLGQLDVKVIIPNIQRLIDEEKMLLRRQSPQYFDWTRYHTLDEINSWLESVPASYPNVTKSITIGTSYEGRKIKGIKISYKSGNPGIFIESNIHAREWITSATATWLINELLTSKHIAIRHLAENYDWYIVPVLNVDGFVYSHERDRLWRKTRSKHTNNKDCVGVDANRNYDNHWLENNGASSDPCSDTYAGTHPFSEPEIRSLANYVKSIKTRINIMLSFHSYGQKLLSPFGYTNSRKPDNYGDLMQVAHAFSDAVSTLSYRTEYQAGTTADSLYIASGDTTDWAYAQGIRLSYTIEFRDKGRYGFILPSAFIIPNCREALTGIFAMVSEAEHLGYMKLKYDQKN